MVKGKITKTEKLVDKVLPDEKKSKKTLESEDNKDALKHDISQFEFLITTLEQERSEEEFQRFLVKTKQVDQYRGNDFYKVFTEYADFIR